MDKFVLQASDGTTHEVSRAVIEQSNMLKNMVGDLDEFQTSVQTIPLKTISAPVLQKIIDYCEHHKDDPPRTAADDELQRREEIDAWDNQFLALDHGTLFDVIIAANYLEIRALLDLACKAVANMIRGKSADEIRRTFNIENDFTPEEERQIREENSWCVGSTSKKP